MPITIVTHTNPAAGRDITRSVESVEAAIEGVSGVTHKIIEHDGDPISFLKARWDATKLDDYVIFVDDDDYIPKNAIKLCKLALDDNPDVGLIYTREMKVMPDGRVVGSGIIALPYHTAILTSNMVHHLSVMNTKYITNESLDLVLKYDYGCEWAMRSEAISKGGALHIPMVGYYWVQHDNQHHKTYTGNLAEANRKAMVKEMQAMWPMKYTGMIPEWA